MSNAPAAAPVPRIVEVRQKVLKQNDLLARHLRGRFLEAGVFVVGLVSSPGSGKTELLEKTLSAMMPQHRVGALVGDLATENDATRLRRTGAHIAQITTGTICHLDAAMVSEALADWDLGRLDVLFIENVGNLVCPSGYDLGENMRAVAMSVTEGEDKPLKYPTIMNTADVAVVTKMDLAGPAGFERDVMRSNIHSVRDGMPIFELSARTGEGMSQWLQYLEQSMRI